MYYADKNTTKYYARVVWHNISTKSKKTITKQYITYIYYTHYDNGTYIPVLKYVISKLC